MEYTSNYNDNYYYYDTVLLLWCYLYSGSSISSSKSSLTTKFAKGAPTGETVFSQHKRCLSLPLTPSSPGLQSPGRSTTVPQSVSPPQRRMNGLVFSSRKTTNERSTTRSEPSPLARPTSYRKLVYYIH